jgi:uncharacterized alpha-E superfamily protein
MGCYVERAQNVIRILEVNHKMHLERGTADLPGTWGPIADAFHLDIAEPHEPEVYAALVLSSSHPYSVRRCIAAAREEGRTLRERISEEMWDELNRYHHAIAGLGFDEIRRKGRSVFNREVESFCAAFQGLADETMIHGPEHTFLRLGRYVERAQLLCRILEIKRKTLTVSPRAPGHPLDNHQWKVLLRSLSGYEPYRRQFDACIVPSRVLAFALCNPRFPRSLAFCVGQVDTSTVMVAPGLEVELQVLNRLCTRLDQEIDAAYFRSFRQAPADGVWEGARMPQQQ